MTNIHHHISVIFVSRSTQTQMSSFPWRHLFYVWFNIIYTLQKHFFCFFFLLNKTENRMCWYSFVLFIRQQRCIYSVICIHKHEWMILTYATYRVDKYKKKSLKNKIHLLIVFIMKKKQQQNSMTTSYYNPNTDYRQKNRPTNYTQTRPFIYLPTEQKNRVCAL